MPSQIGTCAIGAISFVLSGCATVNGGPPRMVQLMKSDSRLSTIKGAIETDCFKLPASGTTASTARRNDLAMAYMLAVDEAYDRFEMKMVGDGSAGNFVATITSLGLATAGSFTGSKTSRILSGANAGVIGEREAFNKEFLFSQTIPALQNQMRANRAAVRKRIYDQMTRGADTWSTCMALQDLRAYEQAGTMVGALNGLTETTAKSKAVNEAGANAAAERIKFDTGGLVTALRVYFSPDDDDLMKSRIALGKGAAMKAANLVVPDSMTVDEFFGRILRGTKYASQQRALALGILATETDAAAREPLIRALSE